MSEPVKQPRRYRSPKRTAQAALTRKRLIDAAQKLFAERGYLGTTIADIAGAAGVAPPTVYAVFSSKPQLLAEAIATAVRGDQDAFSLREQPAWREILDAESGVRAVERFAAVHRSINARAWALMDAARAAAITDPELAAMASTGAANRWANCHGVAEALSARGELRPDIDLRYAADILWATCSAELYRMLVIEQGWTEDAYQQWLERTLAAHLLRPGGD